MNDLRNIRSFGFRGEALPSIASVSRFRLTSAQKDGEGTVLEVLHGITQGISKTARAHGTDVEVLDLFSNVPARLKFLKQPGTEARKCAETVTRMALARLDVEFEFIQGDRSTYHFLTGETLTGRLAAVWPESIVDNLHAVNREDYGMRVSGLAGDPSTAQGRADRILLYVNQRPIQDRIMLSAVREAYRGKILGKEYPQAILFLTLPPGEVDVNVHPAKSEVRFQDERAVFRLVRGAVLHALEHGRHAAREDIQKIPASSFASEAVPRESLRVQDDKFSSSKSAQLLFPDTAPQTPAPSERPAAPLASPHLSPAHAGRNVPQPAPLLHEAQAPVAAPTPESAPDRPVYLGQFDRTYLIFIEHNRLVLLDQHAAHERVLFHALRAQGTRGDRRPLLVPLTLPLHPSQAAAAQEIWSDLLELGFTLELSERRLLIQAVPALLTPAAAREFLEDVLTGKARSMTDLWTMMACKSAIKAGDTLARDEALALLDAWNCLSEKDFCPHGRPVTVRWSVADLEKLFKRR
jgi:DNA mismatch repair protein MutL